MDLHSFGLEVRALRSVTYAKNSEKTRTSMLGRLTLSHFSNEITRKAFRRVSKLVTERGELLDWRDLLEDANLSEEIRDHLRDTDEKPVKTTDKFSKLVSHLDRYRKRRHISEIGREIADILESNDVEEFDEDSCLRQLAERLGSAHSTTNETTKVWAFGPKSNALTMVKQALFKPAETLYKTGYKQFDDTNGGLPTSGVMLMAGATSSGKSVLSMNLLRNIHELNAVDTLKITLEMTAEQEMNRILSMISGVPFSKIKQRKLSDMETKKILKAAKQFNAECKARKARYQFAAPEEGMSIDDTLYMAMAYNCKVLCIDYVGLLEGVDDDSQWRKLSEIVRKAKIYAARTGSLVIILCQLDDESGKIRYSKGMREHADVVWAWNYSDPEVRATRHIPVDVIKVRDGELIRMALKEAFDIMHVGNPEGDAPALPDKKSKSGDRKFKASETDESDKKRRRKLIDSATIADDDDVDRKAKSVKKARKYLVT